MVVVFLGRLYFFFSFSTAETFGLLCGLLGLPDEVDGPPSIQGKWVPGMSGSSSPEDELMFDSDIDY